MTGFEPHLAHAGSSFVAAFAASLVEFVEALTVVMAVGSVRGWRYALSGAAAGAGLLALMVVLFGPALLSIPIGALQFVVGVLLLLFGMRWLRKAVLRSAGIISLHDEAAIYARESAELRAGAGIGAGRWDMAATVTALKAVVLEGLEVVFIVVAVGGAAHMLPVAVAGAALAALIVIALGLILHRPLMQVPENALKFFVGALLTTFGIFWIGEGSGFAWPGGDLSIIGLLGVLLLTSRAAVIMARNERATAMYASAGGVG